MKPCFIINDYISKRSTIDIDLNDLFIEYGIPKLSDIKKMTLEGPIKYEDILIALKCPLIPRAQAVMGLHISFFKFFWKDLGIYLLRAINTCFY